MIRAFNAFQIVTLFAAMPYIIGWLGSTEFPFQSGAYWVAIAVYVVMFFGMTLSTSLSIEKL